MPKAASRGGILVVYGDREAFSTCGCVFSRQVRHYVAAATAKTVPVVLGSNGGADWQCFAAQGEVPSLGEGCGQTECDGQGGEK